jgi:multidrug efflux system outer membrane protein
MRVGYLLLIATALAGCAVGPDYSRPAVTVPPQYRYPEVQTTEAANAAWWEQIGDPALTDLVHEALANNQDVRIAAARVEEFYGALGATRSALFPQVGAEASGQRQRSSERIVTLPSGSNPFNTVQVDAFASWEIDLFGRLRRLTEAARADLLASEDARRGVILSLVTAVASGYVNLRDLDKQLGIAQRTLESRTDALHLFETRYKGGVVSELELAQAQSEYAVALAAIPSLEQRIAQQENALSVLVGRNPAPIARGKTLDELLAPPVPAGLPSELLERRPDIRQAEQSLIAANARIGAAKALYFPTISLTGLFGAASTSLSGLWSGPARTWNYAGSVSMPIFTAGGITGQVRAAEAQQKQALGSYQKTIQTAFQETEDALVGIGKTRGARDAQAMQVEALRTYARLARLRYEGGYTSYLEVLDSERSLFNAELQYAQAQTDVFTQVFGLYKAIGGGWVDEADRLAVQPAVQASETPAIFP